MKSGGPDVKSQGRGDKTGLRSDSGALDDKSGTTSARAPTLEVPAARRPEPAQRHGCVHSLRYFAEDLLQVAKASSGARRCGTGRPTARPLRSPNATPPEVVSKILYLR